MRELRGVRPTGGTRFRSVGLVLPPVASKVPQHNEVAMRTPYREICLRDTGVSMLTPKRSWPLLLLAGCSLLPGFGLLFGAAGVSWGLVSDRPRARLAVVL